MEDRPAQRYCLRMNQMHQWLCSSRVWARSVASDYLPWALEGVTLGDAALEVGPGYRATTRVLVEGHRRSPRSSSTPGWLHTSKPGSAPV